MSGVRHLQQAGDNAQLLLRLQTLSPNSGMKVLN